jgi:hypothetical protein
VADAVRCPACGASNPQSAAWCGQCLRRFDEAGEAPAASQTPAAPQTPVAPEPPAASQSPAVSKPEPVDERPPPPRLAAVSSPQRAVRREGDAVVWTCPACDSENPVEILNCSVCGTALASLFQPETQAPERQRSRGAVLGLSAVLPGAGHIAFGMAAAGLGRAVLYAWSLFVGVFLILRDVRRNAATVHGLGALFLLAAAAVWLLSFAEASRALRGDRTLIAGGRSLTWATAALTFLLFAGLALVVRSR